MTGLSDPYEPPLSPELQLTTVGHNVEQNATTVMTYLDEHGFL
jgi:adenylylsulfate kinase-like enzyme